MNVKQTDATFRKVVITIETEKELAETYQLMNSASAPKSCQEMVCRMYETNIMSNEKARIILAK